VRSSPSRFPPVIGGGSLLLSAMSPVKGISTIIKWRDSALGRGKSAHSSYKCYNKGLELAFDGPGSPAHLLRGPVALLILNCALVQFTISHIINIISDSSASRSEAKGKSGFPRVYRGVSCRFGHEARSLVRARGPIFNFVSLLRCGVPSAGLKSQHGSRSYELPREHRFAVLQWAS
jgi:hypothetical protein